MSHTFTAEYPAHPDYPYSSEALNERLFFSKLNDNPDRINHWNNQRAKSYGKEMIISGPKLTSNKEHSKITNVTLQYDKNHTPSNPTLSNPTSFKNVFDRVDPYLKQQILNLVHNPTYKSNLSNGGRKRTRVFRKKSNKRFTSKLLRRTSRKYK